MATALQTAVSMAVALCTAAGAPVVAGCTAVAVAGGTVVAGLVAGGTAAAGAGRDAVRVRARHSRSLWLALGRAGIGYGVPVYKN